MYVFLVPLGIGFFCNWASALTGVYSGHWGAYAGRVISFTLRMVFGLPVWAIGVGWAFRQPALWIAQPPGALSAVAWIFILAGSSLMLWALGVIGLRAILPSMSDTLASRGPYRYLRHPIYAGLLLDFAAFPLLQPAVPVILASGLGVLYVFVQIRLEEWDLLRRIPSYRSYMEEVPRFIPHIKGVK